MCVLKINAICDKIFVTLFAWLAIVSFGPYCVFFIQQRELQAVVINFCSCVYWLIYLSNSKRRQNNITEWLKVCTLTLKMQSLYPFQLGEPSICVLRNQRRVDRFVRVCTN